MVMIIYHHSLIVGGGTNSINRTNRSFIGAGSGNSIDNTSSYSFIGGGQTNSINNSSAYSFIGGGKKIIIDSSTYNVIGGGQTNSIESSSDNSFIGGGLKNIIDSSTYSSILGGVSNNISHNNCNLIGSHLKSTTASSTHLGHYNVSNSNYLFSIGGGNSSSRGNLLTIESSGGSYTLFFGTTSIASTVNLKLG